MEPARGARVRVGRFIADNSVDVRICADMGTDSQTVCRARDFHPKDKHCSPQRSVKRDAPFSTPVLLQTRKDDNNINEICKRLS